MVMCPAILRSIAEMANCNSTSIDNVPEEFRESLRQANVDNLLEYLSKHSELRLGKNEQRGDPDLLGEEKIKILRNKYDANPIKFLAIFGRLLEPAHLECFSALRQDNYEINFYMAALEKTLSPDAKKKAAKNRRYEALQKLVDTTDYFTEEEMQRRNPILYDQLIGRFHTEQEREAFLFQSATTSSALGSKGDSSYDPNARPTPLTDMLIAHMTRTDGECSSRRMDQEAQMNDENRANNEYTDEDEEMEEENNDKWNSEKRRNTESKEEEEIDDDEKELLKEEFFTTMYRHFLEGKDEDIDYGSIDNNTEYDVGETFEQDEEEKYFDTEEPSHVEDEDSSSRHCSNPMDQTLTQPPDSTCEVKDNDASESDDELDAYMKTIEAELKK